MKRAALIFAALAAILTAAAAPVRTATENFVTNKIAEAVAAIPAPDMSAKQDALPYPTNAIPYDAIAGKPSGMTTNAVCDIVTNEVSKGWSEWHYEWYNVDTGVYFPTNFSQITWNGSAWEKPSDFPQFMWPPMGGEITDANVSFFVFEDGSDNGIEATRQPITRNALGLARLVDLPPLTNGLHASISAVAQASTNYTDEAIRDKSLGGIWDESLQVWWTPRMRNGSLTYEATTNVNLNAEN